MSLSNPRIPKGKLTLSDVKMELFYLDDIEETEEIESPYSKELEQLESHQKELEKHLSAIEIEQQKLANEKAALQAERQAIEELRRDAEAEIEANKQAFEKEKTQIYLTITDFLWDESIDLAERIVHQAIDTRQIEVLPMLTEVIQKLPVAFDKLKRHHPPRNIKSPKRRKYRHKIRLAFRKHPLELRYATGLRRIYCRRRKRILRLPHHRNFSNTSQTKCRTENFRRR